MLAANLLLALGLSHCSSDDGRELAASIDGAAPQLDAGLHGASDALDAARAQASSDGRVEAVRADAYAGDASLTHDADVAAVGTDASASRARFTAQPLSDPPTYMGTTGGSAACTLSFRTLGYAPLDGTGARHPLFLYFARTASGRADESARYDSQAADRVDRAMAERGFVALSVEYDNVLGSFFTDKQACLFGADNAQSLLARACALPAVDCSLGIATWGHGQGASLAHAAANYEPRVRAVWTTGYGGLSHAKLPFDRLRTVNGEGDASHAAVRTANQTAGFKGADQCPDDGRDTCLRSDGSGWIIVRKSACKVTAADHCWFDKKSCADDAETLEPSWVEPSSKAPFALEENADWVARTVARP